MTTGRDLEESSYPLQVTDTEIILSLNAKRNIPLSCRDILSLCLMGLFMFGVGIYLFIPRGGRAPTIGGVLFPIWLIGLGVMILLPSTALLVMSLRSESSRTPRFVRIDHEGVFFSHPFPLMITWGEMSSLVPYTRPFLGQRVTALGIIPQDPETIIARIVAESSEGVLSRFLSKVYIYFYRRSNTLSPLAIPQVTLSMSIDELIALIQERFTKELNEHHLTISEWQS